MAEFKLNKIRLFNFACYQGENTIDFTDNKKKNIYLFNVRNGFGKTSLFQAIKWGFYGENIEYFKDSDQIEVKDFLNDQLDKKKDICFVEIFFEYSNSVYELKRTLDLSKNKNSNFDLVKDNTPLKQDLAELEIDQIMPKEFADFFMFDGEQLSTFTKAQKELYKDTIQQLLGLKQLRILKEDFEFLKRKNENKLTQETEHNKELKHKSNILEQLTREINNHKEKIDRATKEISKNSDIIDKLSEHRARYEKLPKVMDEIYATQEKIDKLNKETAEINTKLTYNAEYLFVSFIKKDLNKLIGDNKKRISELHSICGLSDTQANTQTAKEDILRKSSPKCDVCGHKLAKDEIKKLEEEQRKITEQLKLYRENKEESDELKKENNLFNLFLDKTENVDFSKLLDDLKEKSIYLDELTKKLDSLKKESQKEEYGSLSKINREISQLEEENNNFKNKIKLLRTQIEKLEDDKDRINREIKSMSHDNRNLERLTNTVLYLTKLINLINKALDKGTSTKRDLILKKSNKLFKKITNKPDEYKGIVFENDESYAFVIETNDGRIVTNPSKGEKQVLAMSFLLGLSQYTGRTNAILMDTPVASLDDIHSAGIGNALAELKNQVLFLAQPQELAGAIYDNMKKGIAKEFKVEREKHVSKIIEVKS